MDEPTAKRGYYSELVTATGRQPEKPKLPVVVPRRTQLAWQIATEHHSAIVRDLDLQKPSNFLGEAKRWMSFPEDRSIAFPAETFAPKIQMQENVAPKYLPRNVEMEKRRRVYRNVQIEDALKTERVTIRDMLPPSTLLPLLSHGEKYGLFRIAHFLPLELFDDEEYDCRTILDWINLGTIDGIRYPLPATVFVETVNSDDRIVRRKDRVNSLFRWCHAAVTDYDFDKKQWRVLTLDGTRREYSLPRIYIRFFAENPYTFAKRVANAIELRRISESFIRYNLYLDCMRADTLPTLNDNEKDTIVQLAVGNRSFQFNRNSIPLILTEIEVEYQRTMCGLMWERQIVQNPDMFKFVKRKPMEIPKRAPCKGKIDTAMINFEEMKRECNWGSLYVLSEVYEAMLCIVRECLWVSNMNLFIPTQGRSMTLSEFEAMQTQATNSVIKYLKEPWLEKITHSVRMCLRYLGKGSFNLQQRFHDVYDTTKLKRFMDVVVLRMQYALRELVDNSIAAHVGILETPALSTLSVDNDFLWGDDLLQTQFNPTGATIFDIDIMMNTEKAYCSTDPDEFEEVLLSIYDSGLILCHQVRQVHPFLLPHLKFPPDLYLSSVGLLEQHVCDARERIRTAYRKAIIPLKAYIKQYEKYLDLYRLDVMKYIEEFQSEDHSAFEVKEEIASHVAMKFNIETTVPSCIPIGPFNVNVSPLKEFLVHKKEECSNGLLAMFTEILRSQVDEILSGYTQIRFKLREPPQSIEHIFELRDWIETIPLNVARMDDVMRKLQLDYDVPDAFWWNLSDDDFNAKWEALGYPRQISMEVEETLEQLVDQQDKFYKIQVQDENQMLERIDTLVSNVANIVLLTDMSRVHETALEAKRIWKTMKDSQEQCLVLNERQRLFEVDVVPFDHLNKLVKEFEPYKNLWVTASDWLRWQEIWMENPLINVDPNQIEEMTADLIKAITRSVKIFDEVPKMAAISLDVKKQIEEFKPYANLIKALRDPGMKNRHFQELSTITGIQIVMTPTLAFKSLVGLGIMRFEETVKNVSDAASKEYTIEGTLVKMISDWETIIMDVIPYKNTGTYVMKISDETSMLLDNHIVNVQQLSFSPFKASFEDEINEWEYKLRLTQEVISLWLDVQRQWMYLESIFTSEDIGKQLPVETRKYYSMERNWRRIMKNAYDKPYIIRICPDKNLLESLKECLGLLELVQKGLSDYLEAKRTVFPRFYFLSDEELLEIVAQSKVVRAVQPHLKKCFENISELHFESDDRITKMYSAEYEEVILKPSMYPEGPVEKWLGQVEDVMRNTLREIIGEALAVVESLPRREWVYMWPGQVVLCGGQTYWTAHVENAISNGDLPGYYNTMLLHLDDLRELIRTRLTEVQRLMLEAVITIEVHARDVVEKLIRERIASINDFDWISQLRYYWTDDQQLKVRAVNAEFSYGYEYLGNNGRLVITPLTDRCYLTLTGALHLKFGGAPTGPAGTGKTETTKDLAKAFAIQCVVFNCSDQLDFMSMGKFFKGLASAGAWACFDEFNRIDIEVLSVIAQQIMTIQQAQQIRAEIFIFEGTEIVLKPSCAVFITMNPGYAGRTELPDNLKALFRPVAMMVPDYSLIAEISLFSYGFVEAKNLAQKITTTFKLSSEQLSSQDHYDFGMRAVKTVIACAGNLKREQIDLTEQQICLRALRDVNVPKFLKDDLKLFNGIVSDLFPRLEEKLPDYGILETEIRKSILQMALEDVDAFVKKVIQLYETTVVRHGLMLVGPTGSGKTRCYEALKDALTKLKGKSLSGGKPFTPVVTYVMNPKSLTMGQLYGEYDLDTRDWTDGVLPKLLRTGIAAIDNSKRWYIFDGPVDAVWIENMNTVLDDNKKLCLTSGEIMKLLPTMTMMFEVADLRVASPATVSRCGMVYLDSEILGVEPFIKCWIKSLPTNMSEYEEQIMELTNETLLPGLKLLRNDLREIVPSVDAGIVKSYINLMDFRIEPMTGRSGKPPPQAAFQQLIPTLLAPWTAFAITWSVGATCDFNGRCKVNNWLRNLQGARNHNLPFPEKGLIFDYRLHDGGFTDPIEGKDPIEPRWYKWMDDISPVRITPEIKYADIEVPTIDSVRSAALIGYLLNNKNNVLCIGPTGSGKTLTISAKLARNMPKKFVCDFITFSARTTAKQTQDLIDGKLDKRRKGIYGPPLSKAQVFFIDDFNMPALEVFGAQPPIELIRQFMDFGGWYDRKEIGTFRVIQDVNFVVAMGPPGGGRNPVTARLLRHFHFIAFPEMEDNAKMQIFGTILKSWMPSVNKFQDILMNVVSATLKVFSTISNELLPTPDKSHYTFNLRDLSKVFQGILMVNSEKIRNLEDLFVLWYHENLRVFSDRLVNNDDRKWFNDLLHKILKDQFTCDLKLIIGNEFLYYGGFCQRSKEYGRIENIKKMEEVLEDFLEDYNNQTTSPMKLVLFQDAMDHICRINRILRQPRGNALLLGMGGSGRQSLTKLSAYMQEYSSFQIELGKGYTANDWREDIKGIMLKTGMQDQIIVFIFSDTQIKTDAMLEDLNGILNSGDVPNIYQLDELERIFHAMRASVQEAGLPMTRSNLFGAYLKLVRNNLHTVVTMSPVGELFRARIRQFPALVNCCTIDWFSPWPPAALQSVAMHFLSDITDESVTEDILKSIVKTCQYMHSSVTEASVQYLTELNRHNYVTPTSYLELLSGYGDLLTKTKSKLNADRTRLSTGLEKLASTEAEVKDMQEILRNMKPQLEQAAEATAKMIQRITKDTAIAEKMRAEAVAQETAASKLKLENQIIRDDAEADLSVAKPMLLAAEAALKALNRNDVTEVKAMKRPPVGVVLVIEAMCIVNNVKPHKLPGKFPGETIPDYWTPGSQMLADPGNFLNMMENYDKNNLTEDIIKRLKYYIENPDFQPVKILKVSKACHSFCLWVHAMYNYFFVKQRVLPKMEALALAEETLTETEETLARAMAKLNEIEEGLATLQKALQAEEERKEELEKQKQLCEDRMGRAVRLVVGLAGEQKRWIVTVGELSIALKNVTGDVLLASGAIAYLTPFTDTYRDRLLSKWQKILGEGVPHTMGSTPVSTLGDPIVIRAWQIDGLPRDTLSVENAVLMLHSNRWPLFIDPQGQANKWIRNMCNANGLSVAKMTDKDTLRVLETCIRFGKACLIENVGIELEAGLDPVLSRSIFKHAGQPSIKIGDNVVPYHSDFRLFMTTRLPNPHYTPEVAVKVLLVNFALTASGLQDQMLSLVTIQERPDLEQTRNLLIVSNAEMRKELKDIENRILYRLSVSEGSTVDDIDLILTLEASKVKSEEIKGKMEIAEATHADIEATRSLYIPVAIRAQILYFCLSDLQYTDTMYQYSLEWFIGLFNSTIAETEKSNDIDKRINDINDNFTFTLFKNVCRSLFERHKLLFAFILCIRIRMNDGLIDSKEWRHFLAGPVPNNERANPAPDWLTPRCWKDIQALEVLPKFQKFTQSFERSLSEFKNIFDAQEAHLVELPAPWNKALDDFQKLLVLRCLRPDKVTNAMQIYLAVHLGQQFVEPQTAEISAIYEQSSPTRPIVFILSPGTDPAAELYKFADRLKLGKKLHSISLGQGQGPRAEAMLKQSAQVGYWVFFQNCHLAPSWMPMLETLVEGLTSGISHREFRLWLTSAPSPNFPVSILQNSSKMTMEPPRGIKANMLRAYMTEVSEMQDFLHSEHSKVSLFKWLTFSLSMFHSILLERRKFGPLGFNIPYEFTEGDLTICLSQLHMFLMEYDDVPYKVLRYTAGHINYGGRITDDWDRRCVLTILNDYYNPKVVSADYQFSDDGTYRQLPTATTFNEYIDYIKMLPLNDEPSIFGLHSNADISSAQAETYACLETLLALQPKDVGAAAASVEETTTQLAKDMLSAMPATFDLLSLQTRYPVLYEESLNTVLSQEAKRYNGLLEIVTTTLIELVKALKGLVVMSEKLERMANSLYNNRIPQIWQDKGYPSLKSLGAWFIDLRKRIEFLKNWENDGIPPAFWISGFYFPQAFLTGILQNFARKYTISIDAIAFSFQVLRSIRTERPKDGCVIYGLFLEGCRWGGNYLEESLPKELYTEMRPILLLPEIEHTVPEEGMYVCPVYKTTERAGTLSTTGHSTNFVLPMELPSKKLQSHWIKRGVALICALNY